MEEELDIVSIVKTIKKLQSGVSVIMREMFKEKDKR